MINEDKALSMFCEKYKEKYKGEKMEAGDTEVVVLNNCIMIISISDENLDMYEEGK